MNSVPMISETKAARASYEILPKLSGVGEIDGTVLEVAMGPHHPSTHGVISIAITKKSPRTRLISDRFLTPTGSIISVR